MQYCSSKLYIKKILGHNILHFLTYILEKRATTGKIYLNSKEKEEEITKPSFHETSYYGTILDDKRKVIKNK